MPPLSRYGYQLPSRLIRKPPSQRYLHNHFPFLWRLRDQGHRQVPAQENRHRRRAREEQYVCRNLRIEPPTLRSNHHLIRASRLVKKKPSTFLWYLALPGFWFTGIFIQERLDDHPREEKREQRFTLIRKYETDTILIDGLERSLNAYDQQTKKHKAYVLPDNALATSLSSKTRIREHQIKNKPKESAEIKSDKGLIFIDSNKQTFAASKLGLDLKHHFQNCFLVGYHPFKVSEIWMPHEVLNMRLKYQLDKDNFSGFQEIWLTSYEAFQRGRGDCEDHAIALTDWLIEMGEDARVVTGTHDGGGHAWVVLIREKGTFLIESTSKKRRRLFTSYPLAKLAKGYVPETMFNREFYWTNTRLEETCDYTGKHWLKNGRVTY